VSLELTLQLGRLIIPYGRCGHFVEVIEARKDAHRRVLLGAFDGPTLFLRIARIYCDLGTLPLLSSIIRRTDSGREMLTGTLRSIFHPPTHT
jgi:hypothetical protein